MNKIKKFSYYFLAAFLLIAGWIHLVAPFILVLFSVLVLRELRRIVKRPAISIVIYILLVSGIFFAVYYAGKEAVQSVPDIADRSIPIILEWTTKQGIELPFTDIGSFKAEVVRGLQSEMALLASSAEHATRQLVVMLLALVVSASIFLNPKLDLTTNYPMKNNLYSRLCNEISERFGVFYSSFKTVMGAQVVISLINTTFTSIFIFSIGLPHRFLIIVATFLCGLIPVVGNIISNTFILGIAATVAVWKMGGAFVFLVVLHKFEYFLNSKIIGERIKNPMWLTLSSLIFGEYILGIPGMILAPVVLQYIKTEMSRLEA